MSATSSFRDHDRLMRLPIIVFTLFFFVREWRLFLEFIDRPPLGIEWPWLLSLAARIALLAFLGLLIFFHATRSRPINKASGWEPKISALLGLTFGNLLLLLDRPPIEPWSEAISTLLLILGNYLCIVVVLQLGKSISIMAEARKLVTRGPYQFVRHPLYLAEEIATIGIFFQFVSWPAAVILLAHFGFQIRRMLNEERILAATFPEYAAYAQRTPRLIPGIW
ncbi:MAG: isoprenylcysteine carboxylmethyltransferase family protein [Gallionella sp.]|nr:isoprenylcysteine carboxylmethyltransferase family protein [Gallionella sp.]